MRYRRLSYRYSLVLARGGLEPLRLASQHQPGVHLAQTCWRPPADVYETSDAVVITAEVGGMEHDDIEVLLYEDALVVEGERRIHADADAVYHSVEIRQGRFRLDLPLPPGVDRDRVDARYERGVLRVVIGKSEGR